MPRRIQMRFKFFTFKDEISPVIALHEEDKSEVAEFKPNHMYKLDLQNKEAGSVSEEEAW